MKYPQFKYVAKGEDVLQYSDKGVVCQCCGKTANFYTDLIYSEQDVDVICVECVKSGLACEKFNGTFNETKEINNIEAVDEVVCKTPILPTYQEFIWPDCCDDMCKYLRCLMVKDLEDAKILQDLEETFNDDYISLEELKTFSSENILLFQCLHCGKYFVILDLD